MIHLPTPDEAIQIGPGPPLTQPEAIRILAEVLGSETVIRPDTRLTPFAAWALWFYRWVKGRMSALQEVQFHQLLRKLTISNLPARLDRQWQVWQDKGSGVYEGWDIVFCDGYVVTWGTGTSFFHLQTMKWLETPTQPPLEKLGLDAVVLFNRCANCLVSNREKEAKDGGSRDTTEARPGSQNQGGA